jgi:hypothetical protein
MVIQKRNTKVHLLSDIMSLQNLILVEPHPDLKSTYWLAVSKNQALLTLNFVEITMQKAFHKMHV